MIPTISVPAYNVPAITNVLATPLMLSANAPGFFQYLKPIFWGPIPPEEMTIATMKKITMLITLIRLNQNLKIWWSVIVQQEWAEFARQLHILICFSKISD